MTAQQLLTDALAASLLVEHEGSDRAWDLVVRYEDGDDTIWADARNLSDEDRILIQSETAIIDAKRLVAAQYRETAARPPPPHTRYSPAANPVCSPPPMVWFCVPSAHRGGPARC